MQRKYCYQQTEGILPQSAFPAAEKRDNLCSIFFDFFNLTF